MSRSYKKSPVYTDGKAGSTSISKRYANKAVRNYNGEIPNGKFYKHLFCSYDIHDYISRWTWEEAKQDYNTRDYLKDRYSSEKEFYNKNWAKYCKRK